MSLRTCLTPGCSHDVSGAMLCDACVEAEGCCTKPDCRAIVGISNQALLEVKQLKAEIKRLLYLLPHLVDVVWGEANEDTSVPSSDWARRMIDKADATLELPK